MNGSLITKRNIREPIEYVIDDYFKNKKLSYSQRAIKNSGSNTDTIISDSDLPKMPVTLLRNEKGEVYKVVYGNLDLLISNEEGDPLIWQQEIIKENGEVTKIIKTYPNGSTVEIKLKKDADNQLIGVSY